MDVTKTSIDGLVVLGPGRSGADERGIVREFFRASDFAARPGPPPSWQQLNVTESRPGAVRGLHGEPMAKLVGLARGQALGAYVDTRPDSPTFRQVCTVPLTVGTRVMVPRGVCNGFQTSGSEPSIYVYAFDAEWRPDMGGTAVSALDPALGIDWPAPIAAGDRGQVSAKDAGLPLFAEVYGVPPLPPLPPKE